MAAQFSKPWKTAKLWQDDAILSDSKSAQGKHTGAWLDFGAEHEVLLKVGISFVSQEGAAANLRQEIPGWDFDDVHDTARQIWNQALGRVAAEGGTPDQRTIFYTGLYHSLLSPNVFSDHDTSYIGFDDKIRSLAGSKQGVQYANFSDWDIYRNTIQLQALLDATRTSDMAQSLVNDAAQSGWYPRWPAANDVTYVMGGDSPIPVIASAYAFGAQNFDLDTALQYMVKAGSTPGPAPHNNAERPYPGRLPQAWLCAQRQRRNLRIAHTGIRQRRLRHRAVRQSHRSPDRVQAVSEAIAEVEEPSRPRNRLDSPPQRRRKLAGRI